MNAKKKTAYSKVIWSIVFIVIAALSVVAIVTQSRDFTAEGFWDFLKAASPAYLAAAFAAMLGFVVFEGLAIMLLAKSFGYRSKAKDGLIYSASDIYFSAITPSATGGQPASAYFMIKDGIPGAVTTVILLLNLIMYALAILIIGVVSFILRPGIFLSLGLVSRILVIVGIVAQMGIIVLFWLLLKKEKLLFGFCSKVLGFLQKIHLLKNRQKYEDKLSEDMVKYRECSEALKGRGKTLFGVLLCNLVQRFSTIMVTVFTFLATGGELSNAIDIWATQSFVVLGSNCVPIPGAIGVSDYIMLDGFQHFAKDPVSLELLSRSVSFYFCIVLCGVYTLVAYLVRRRRHHKNDSESLEHNDSKGEIST